MEEARSTRRLRVVLLLSALGRGGAQRQAVVTAIGLRAAGHDVTCLTLRPGGPLEADLRSAGVPVGALGGTGRLGAVRGRIRLLFGRSLVGADVVYAYLPAANVTSTLVALVRRGPNVVWGIRDSGLDLDRYGTGTRVVSWLADRLASSPRLIICNSEAARRFYAGLSYPTKSMMVIPNGIDTDRFTRNEHEAAAARERIGVPLEADLVLCVARGDPMKGQSDLIAAFALLTESRPGAWLVLLGDHTPGFEQSMWSLAESKMVADRLLVLQGTDAPEAFYSAADLVVLPSRYGEGFPNVLAEALACGAPVVATDVGDAATVVGDHGLVARPSDVSGLAESMERVLSAPDRFGSASERSERIRDGFSIEQLVRRTEHALIEVSR